MMLSMKSVATVILLFSTSTADKSVDNENKNQKPKRGVHQVFGYGFVSDEDSGWIKDNIHDTGKFLSYPVAKLIAYPVERKVPVPYPVVKPVPYPVTIEKKVPVPLLYPVAIEKKVPIPYAVVKPVPYPVHVEKKVPVPVPIEKPVPYLVEKKIPIPYPVHIQVPAEKPMSHPVEKEVPIYLHYQEQQVPAVYEQQNEQNQQDINPELNDQTEEKENKYEGLQYHADDYAQDDQTHLESQKTEKRTKLLRRNVTEKSINAFELP